MKNQTFLHQITNKWAQLYSTYSFKSLKLHTLLFIWKDPE